MSEVKIKDEFLVELITKKLREQIREEVRQEMQQVQEVKEKPWKQVRDHIEKRLLGTMKRWDTYKIQNAIYLIIRFSLNISGVSHLREEQVEQAIAISDQIIEMVTFPEIQQQGGY